MCRFWLGLLGVMGIFSRTARAAAQPAELDYLAPASCPDAAMFEREVSARLGDKATLSAADRALRIRIERGAPRSYLGRVEFLSHPGAPRELSAETCEELTQALALVVAVVWNPDAQRATPIAGDATTEEGEASQLDIKESASVPALPRRGALEAESPPGASREAFQQRWLARAWLGIGLDSLALPTPTVLPRLGLAAETSVAPRISLSVGVSAALPSSQSASTNGVEGNFSFGAVRGEGCGAFAFRARTHFEACGVVEVGRLAGESPVSPQSEQAVVWVAPGVLGRVRVRVAGALWFEGGAGALWAVRRPIFFVDKPDASRLALHEVPSSGLAAELAAAVRLP